LIKRVFKKLGAITDSIVWKVHSAAESGALLSRVPYTIYKEISNAELVDHLYPVNYDQKHKLLFQHYTGYKTANETIFKFTNVNVSREGVIFKRGNNIGLSFPHIVFRAEYGWRYLLKHYLTLKKKPAASSKTYILLHDFWSAGNYYHWLIDSLPRLLSVKEELASDKFSLLLPSDPPKFIVNTLKWFNISDITYINKGEYLYISELLLPYYLAGSGHIHPEKVSLVKSFFTKAINSTVNFEKIYVSRGKQKARRVKNESEIVEIMIKHGFKVVYFEDHSFDEQVNLARKAKIMISSHGANLTNVMFMEAKTKVLELIRSDTPNFCYWALASVCGIRYYYQLCDVVGHDDLLVDIDQFKFNLNLLLND
jgi:hypothetical protein